jgi:predicted permease
VVLDHGYWKSRFGGDRSIVGKTLIVERHPATVIGVTPASFPGTTGLVRPAAYVPFSTWEGFFPGLRQALEDRRNTRPVVGRLRDEVSLEGAQAAVTAVAARLEKEYPATNERKRFFVFPEPLTRIEPAAASYLPRVAAVSMIMVSLVLLIACTNVANMLLSRAAERRREIAVRSALGAGRLGIARQLLIESGIISLGGGIAGSIVAVWVARLLTSIPLATELDVVIDVSVDHRVLGFVTLVALAAGLLAGLAPALHAARSNLAEALKEGGRAVASGGRRFQLRDLLVIGQVAVSLVLLVGTALLVRSMVNLSRFDFGFDTRDRLVMTVNTYALEYDLQQRREFFRALLERVHSHPAMALINVPARAIGISAAIGLTLAALGLYAVIAYSISTRIHEIGVRLATGATPSDIVRLVLAKGLVLGAIGIAVGVLLARLIIGRFAYLLVGVGAGDPLTYVGASLVVLLVALIASYFPARFRAAPIDPAVALREE